MATYWREGHYRNGSWVEGHKVMRNSLHESFTDGSYYVNEYSVTIPNIICKCCKKEIYFYKSSDGGKVFFNELGHPWIKHCCEPKCCANENETIPYDKLNMKRNCSYIAEPLWKKNGWEPAIFIKEIFYNHFLRKIIFKSLIDKKEYDFFIPKNLFLDIKKSLVINFKVVDSNFYEISFYSNKQQQFIGSKEPNINDLEDFLKIKNAFLLLKKDNIKNIELASIFFQLLDIHNNYFDKREQIYQLILSHQNSIKSGMAMIYSYILKEDLVAFEKYFLKNFNLYHQKIVHILLIISTKETLPLKKIQEIILNKWKKKKWTPYLYKKRSRCDSSVEKIIFFSIEKNIEESFFIQKKYLNIILEKNIVVFIKPIDEIFFEIFFYNNNFSKEFKLIISKYPSNYELETFIIIQNSLNLISKKDIKDIELVKIFFQILNISEKYKNEKDQLFHFILNHKSSKESGMIDIYEYINKFNLKKFEENFLNKFQYYDENIINIFSSINNISSLDEIHKIILKKRGESLRSNV